MTCISHHKVPNQYAQKHELNCDGFIFEDEKGNKWFNQYPDASYGQFSDTADGIVMLDLSNKKIKEWENNGQKFFVMYDALRLLDEIYISHSAGENERTLAIKASLF